VLSGEDSLFPLHVAAGARGGISVTANDKASPYLLEISRSLGETTNLHELDGSEFVLVARFPGQHLFNIDIVVRSALPAFFTASGTAILSRLSEAERRDILARTELTQITPYTETNPDILMKRVRRAGERGQAIITNETLMGDIAVARSPISMAALSRRSTSPCRLRAGHPRRPSRTRAACPSRRHVDLEGEVHTLSAVSASISPAQDAMPHDGANSRHDGAGHCVPDRDKSRAVILACERVGQGPDRCGKHSNDCSREEGLCRRAFPHEDEGQDHGWQRKKKNGAQAEDNCSVGPPHDRKTGWIEYDAQSQENDRWR